MSDMPPATPSAAASTPPPPPPPPTPQYGAAPSRSGRAGLWIALAAVVALIVGVGIGAAAMMPSMDEVAEQRDEARIQVTDLQRELTLAQSSASSSSGARDTCSRAATDAKDLITQHENLWSDFDTLISAPSGSAAQAEMIQHMNSQQQTMRAQREIVNEELADCRNAISS